MVVVGRSGHEKREYRLGTPLKLTPFRASLLQLDDAIGICVILLLSCIKQFDRVISKMLSPFGQ